MYNAFVALATSIILKNVQVFASGLLGFLNTKHLKEIDYSLQLFLGPEEAEFSPEGIALDSSVASDILKDACYKKQIFFFLMKNS